MATSKLDIPSLVQYGIRSDPIGEECIQPSRRASLDPAARSAYHLRALWSPPSTSTHQTAPTSTSRSPPSPTGSYVLHGSGAVIVTEGEFRVHGEGRVEAALTYTPFSQEAELPEEVIEQINHYDPELQCVFIMADSEGKAESVMTLNAAEHMGSTPKMLFEEAIKKHQHVPILPGIVVRLKDCVGDIEPGWFVFLGEEKSDMILSPAGEDEDVVATEEVHRVHIYSNGPLEITNIRVGTGRPGMGALTDV